MEQDIEIWKDVVGYEGSYMVSSVGRIKSIDRITNNPLQDNCILKGRIMKQGANIHGYPNSCFCKNNIKKTKSIHRMVAQAFIPNPENKPQVNHIDGNKKNNRVNNLEWNTSSENLLHAHRTGLKKNSDKQRQSARDTFSKKVINIVTGEIFDSVKIAAEANGIKKKTLSCYFTGQNPNKTNLRYL